jgi:hypothetical protein
VRKLSRGSYNWLRLKGLAGRNKITLGRRVCDIGVGFFLCAFFVAFIWKYYILSDRGGGYAPNATYPGR